MWRGGAAFLIAEMLKGAAITNRRVWLFDSFAGLPAPQATDGPVARAYGDDPAARWENCRASLDEVVATARTLDLLPYARFIEGWFDETLMATRDRCGPIALLRIDADWYASVRCCLDALYDQVSPGGVIIFDDYHTWPGCTLAVHEFLAERRLAHPIATEAGVASIRK